MRLLILLAALSLAACNVPKQEPDFMVRKSKGQTIEQATADQANCRNQARIIAGVNSTAWYSQAYTDCMVGKGYDLVR